MKDIHFELDRIFSALEIEEAVLSRYRLDLKDVVPVSHVSLDTRMDGLEIKSVGAESVFEFMSMPASNDKTFRILRLSICLLYTSPSPRDRS